MELNQIVQVEYEYEERKINQRLKEGWVILNTASGTTEDGQAFITVLLGLPAKD